MVERLICLKECLMCEVEAQMEHLDTVDTKEMGEVIDMIKDLEEAIYYCTVVKAMKHEGGYEAHEMAHLVKEHEGEDMSHYMGKSHKSRKMYMEAKEKHVDKASQMKELEKYAQELTADIIEMMGESTPEERQYLSKKVTALANKITQLTD